jgi:hypothetical protein
VGAAEGVFSRSLAFGQTIQAVPPVWFSLHQFSLPPADFISTTLETTMPKQQPEPLDEDDIGIADTGAPSDGEPFELQESTSPAPRIKIGHRPRGLPKTGGRVKGVVPKVELQKVDANLLRIAQGQKVRVTGPTGKLIWTIPDISQQLRAAEALKYTPPPAPAPVVEPEADEPEPPDAESVKRAIAEDYIARNPQLTVRVVDPSDGSVVTSITDPEQIKKFDADRAAYEVGKSSDNSNSKTFANGFSWQKKFDPTPINPSGIYTTRAASIVVVVARRKKPKAGV